MNALEGMIRDTGYDGCLSLDLWSRQAADMRAREEFREGYMVKCPGVRLCKLGQVMAIDPDERLAKVAWMSGLQGWWYLKDLVVVGIPAELRMKSLLISKEVPAPSFHEVAESSRREIYAAATASLQQEMEISL